jgi:hypothetical protein
MTDDDDLDVLDDDGRTWGGPAFDYTTPLSVVLQLAEQYGEQSIRDFREQLQDDPELDAATIERMVRHATPQMRTAARDAFISGWTRLQLERQQTQ